MKRKDIISTIISTIIIFCLCVFDAIISVNAQTTYKQEGNIFSSVKTIKTVNPEKTPYVWKDSKGKEYPIYISDSGSCFVIRISSKTGKEYRQYMTSEVSETICKELNRTYKPKTNSDKKL